MIHICIDESGNLGRGGKYFVLAAVVFDTDSGRKRASRVIKKAQKRLADEANQAIIEELKSSKMSFPQRQAILQKLISKADIALTDYLRIKAFTKIGLDKRTIEVVQRDSKTMRNLQTADLIAGTVYRAYNNQQLPFLNLIKARIVSADEFPRNSFDGSLISNI